MSCFICRKEKLSKDELIFVHLCPCGQIFFKENKQWIKHSSNTWEVESKKGHLPPINPVKIFTPSEVSFKEEKNEASEQGRIGLLLGFFKKLLKNFHKRKKWIRKII